MKFKVIGCCYEDASRVPPDGADFLLEEDGWNDYNYITFYHLHATAAITGTRNLHVGYIRIMKIGQKEKELFLLRGLFKKELFTSLPDDFVSMSTGVNTWRTIERFLSHEQIVQLVNSLNIITSESDPAYIKVKNDPCFKISLLRDTSMDDYGLKLAREIIANQGRKYDLISQPMKFMLPGSDNPIYLDFSTGNRDLDAIKEVPSRLLAFIGNNGVGKSTMLYRLIKIFYSAPDIRSMFKNDYGEVIPNDVGFSELFVVSYSALDNFTMPGMSKSEVMDIIRGIDGGYGRLVFCGLRDVRAEYAEAVERANAGNDDLTSFGKVDTEHVEEIKLKPVSTLADEFARAMEHVKADRNKFQFWNNVMSDFSTYNDALLSFTWEEYEYRPEVTLKDLFLKQSTGLKFILHSLSVILSRIEWNSIILFDEPENHLQPPLLSKFLHIMRCIAHENASLIMVATHSPVILQETFSANVIIVNRTGNKFSFRRPDIETYGENIGAITNEVFGLNSSITTYFKVADMLYERGMFQGGKNLDKVGSEIRAYILGKMN